MTTTRYDVWARPVGDGTAYVRVYEGHDRRLAANALRAIRLMGGVASARVMLPGASYRRVRVVPGSPAARALTLARYRVWQDTPRHIRRVV